MKVSVFDLVWCGVGSLSSLRCRGGVRRSGSVFDGFDERLEMIIGRVSYVDDGCADFVL